MKKKLKAQLRFQVSLMYEVTAEMEEVVKAPRGFNNNRVPFVHKEIWKEIESHDFGGGNIQQAVIKLAFHSFLLICQALC